MYENEALIMQLKRFKEYILREDIPEWQQLIAVGGFVIDVIQQLKWSEHEHLYSFNSKIDVMSCNDIADEIIFAVNHHLGEVFPNKSNISKDKIEDVYPNISVIQKKYFKIDLDLR